MKPIDYFATHPVFRFEDFASSHREGGERKPETSLAVLKQHVRAGHLLRVRRGLYAVVPRGHTPETVAVDPYVLASHMAKDAVVAFHGALQFHGKAHSISRRYPFLTCTRAKPFVFRGAEFASVPVPPPLRKLPVLGGGILEKGRGGTAVRARHREQHPRRCLSPR